jgi:hypothetical protein
MSRLPDHLQPAAIVEQQKQSKFICSACGSARDCDCAAPAMERIAEIREQKRQAQAKWREKSKENNGRVASTEEARLEPPVTENERREARRYYDERNRKDVEDLKKIILKYFFVLPLRDQDQVLDAIDKLRTERLERAE